MAPKAPQSLSLCYVMRNLYDGAMQLVEVDGAITPQELTLANNLIEAIELAKLTDHHRRAAIAELNGFGDTNHQRRLERELKQNLQLLRLEHEARISQLRFDVTRITVPLSRSTTICERQSQTA